MGSYKNNLHPPTIVSFHSIIRCNVRDLLVVRDNNTQEVSQKINFKSIPLANSLIFVTHKSQGGETDLALHLHNIHLSYSKWLKETKPLAPQEHLRKNARIFDIEHLIDAMITYKVEMSYEGLDLDADKPSMYDM